MQQADTTITAKLHRLLTRAIEAAEAQVPATAAPVIQGVAQLRLADPDRSKKAEERCAAAIDALAKQGEQYRKLVSDHAASVKAARNKKGGLAPDDVARLGATFVDERQKMEACFAAMLASLAELHASSQAMFEGVELVQLYGPAPQAVATAVAPAAVAPSPGP